MSGRACRSSLSMALLESYCPALLSGSGTSSGVGSPGFALWPCFQGMHKGIHSLGSSFYLFFVCPKACVLNAHPTGSCAGNSKSVHELCCLGTSVGLQQLGQSGVCASGASGFIEF